MYRLGDILIKRPPELQPIHIWSVVEVLAAVMEQHRQQHLRRHVMLTAQLLQQQVFNQPEQATLLLALTAVTWYKVMPDMAALPKHGKFEYNKLEYLIDRALITSTPTLKKVPRNFLGRVSMDLGIPVKSIAKNARSSQYKRGQRSRSNKSSKDRKAGKNSGKKRSPHQLAKLPELKRELKISPPARSIQLITIAPR